jgi:hypothetical protein
MNEYLLGKRCPYCDEPSVYVHSAEVYYGSDRYGMIYLCRPCQAWVGVHKGTDRALGRLANAELRAAKHKVHELMNELHYHTNWLRHKFNSKIYPYLSRSLNLPIEETHIGMFNVEQCKQAIEVLKQFQW